MSQFSSIIAQLVVSEDRQEDKKQLIQQASVFDEAILEYQERALQVWDRVMERYREYEDEYSIPYRLVETPKLYAIDPLIVAEPFFKDKDTLDAIAQIFTVFYLIVHFFDDHVEHRDKFYSKFDFQDAEQETQKGAAPFSFVLTSLSMVRDIVGELKARGLDVKCVDIERALTKSLLIQTQYFSVERVHTLKVNEILEVKQRQVSGEATRVIADIMKPFLDLDDEQMTALDEGLVGLGSLTQITDDIRDAEVDATLRNANIVNAAMAQYGYEKGLTRLSEIYHNEEVTTRRAISRFYSDEHVKLVLSIPFYPFFVDKRQIRERNMSKES